MLFKLSSRNRIARLAFASTALCYAFALSPFTWSSAALAEKMQLAQASGMQNDGDAAIDMPIPQPKFKQVTNDAAAPEPINQAVGGDMQSSNASPDGRKNIGLATAQNMAQKLADKFSRTRYMMGEFMQYDARGNMTRGRFFLQRPGKILFDYKNAPLRVISDGQNIAVNNRRLRSWNLYKLNKSPLNLLLADKINIANGRLLEFTQDGDKVTLVLGDSTGRSKIALNFNAQTSQLEKWTMTENGQKTEIQLFNTRTDITFPRNMFDINYYRYPKKR